MNDSERLLHGALSGDERHQAVFLAALASWLTVVARSLAGEAGDLGRVLQNLKDCNELSNRVSSELYALVAGKPSGRSLEVVAATILELVQRSPAQEDFIWAIRQAAMAAEDEPA